MLPPLPSVPPLIPDLQRAAACALNERELDRHALRLTGTAVRVVAGTNVVFGITQFLG